MKLSKITFSMILSGLSVSAMAQVIAPISPQYTRMYSLAEINALARTLDTTNIKENVFCSSVDTATDSALNIKRVFALNSSGTLSAKTLNYAKTASSSSTQSASTRNVSVHSGTFQMPILTTSLQGFSPLAATSSGNTRVFTYVEDGKTKTVIATSAGFFYTFGNSNYMKGC